MRVVVSGKRAQFSSRLACAREWRRLLGSRCSDGRSGRLRCLLFQHRPVEGVVVLMVQRAEQNPEKLP